MEANQGFLHTYGGRYGYGGRIESIRDQEFARLRGITYLDNTGCTQYPKSILERFHEDLKQNVYGNPHSSNPSSQLTTDIIDHVRYRILQHFNTTAQNYTVIFTSGATGALRLLAESFDWQGKCSGSQCHSSFSFLDQNHTSVVGMRETAVSNGAQSIPVTEEDLESRLCEASKFLTNCNPVGLGSPLDCSSSEISAESRHPGSEAPHSYQAEETGPTSGGCDHHNLFAYPAMCNFSGRKYPLDWVRAIQALQPGNSAWQSMGKSKNWLVLLDAASYISTSPLDLTTCTADFIPISFYKLFGFPTGLGALLVRNESGHTLRKCYYGGGSVAATITSEQFHVPRSSLSERFEDGTLPFLDIIALRHGFNVLQALTGGMSNIMEHTFSLAQYVHHQMSAMKHGNGHPICELYCDTGFDVIQTQGPIISFNLLRSNGEYIGYSQVEKLASLNSIHLRTGCFCNTGACQKHLGITNEQLKSNLQAGHVCGDNLDLINELPTGAVRISFGYMSNFEDAQCFLKFVEETFLEQEKTCSDGMNDHLACEPADGGRLNTSEQKAGAINVSVVSKTSRVGSRLGKEGCESDEQVSGTKNMKPEVVNGPVADGRCSGDKLGGWHQNSVAPNGPEVREAAMSDSVDFNQIVLERICLYPIKSCGAFKVDEWEVGPRGLLFDRQWMVVSDSGYCISQKRESRLCQIMPKVCLDSGMLLIDAPGMQTLTVPLREKELPSCEASLCQARVCGDRISALDCGEEAGAWLTQFLRKPCRLLQQNLSQERVGPTKGQGSSETFSLSLANDSQYLLVSRSSVSQLHIWIRQQAAGKAGDEGLVGAEGLLDRFRPNLVVSGAVPFEEDCWTSLVIGDLRFKGLCSRCQMVCLDQKTGARSAEPLRTLGKTRGSKIPFGIHLAHSSIHDPPYRLRCGATVTSKVTPDGEG